MIRRDYEGVTIFATNEDGTRDYSEPALAIYADDPYTQDGSEAAKSGDALRISVQFRGGSAALTVSRRELLEALGAEAEASAPAPHSDDCGRLAVDHLGIADYRLKACTCEKLGAL